MDVPSEVRFAASSREEFGAVVFAPRGRIDQASAENFRQLLEPFVTACKAGAPPLVLDFSAVDYISSVGLRVLMLASRQTTQQQGRFAVAALTPVVREVFEISRFNLVLKVFDNVEAAAASL